MLTFTLLAVLVGQPVAAPIPFDTLSLERAEQLHGLPVTITSARPAYTWGEGKAVRTWCGPVGLDLVKRTVSLKGNRLELVEEGRKVRVAGVLRVIRHGAAFVDGGHGAGVGRGAG